MNLFFGTLYRIAEWITKFAFLYILWLFFTIVGLGVFGFFPATISMFSIIRNWILGNPVPSLPKEFWSIYKKEFMKSNIFGIFIIIIYGLIVLNFIYIELNNPFSIINVTLLALNLYMLVYTLFLYPAYSHFNVNILQLYKNTFLILLISPIEILFIVFCLAVSFIIFKFIPALGFIFGLPMLAFIISIGAIHSFRRISNKSKQV